MAIRKPDLFIIGAPKCGTTALSIYLLQHRRIFFCWPKEPTYFAAEFDGYRFIRDETEYLRQFEGANEGHLAVGEGSTWYLYSKGAVERILDFNPDARFIVMLRNPAEMVPSLHNQLFNSCDEDQRDFRRAWDLQDDRKAGRRLPPGCREPSFLYYGDVGRFSEQLERLYASAGRDRIKVILFDDFRNDAGAVYGDVLDFLGVPWDGRTEFPVANASRTMKWPLLSRIATRPSRFRQAAVGMFKKALGVERIGFSDLIQKVNYKVAPRRTLDPETWTMVQSHYRDDIDALADMLGRDLGHWRRPEAPKASASDETASHFFVHTGKIEKR